MPKLEPLDISFCKTLETTAVLRATAEAESILGKLKGIVQSMPNPLALLSALRSQEAKASSEIENIITTDDDLFRSAVDKTIRGSAQEVSRCAVGLSDGFLAVKKNKVLRLSTLLKVQECLIGNKAGLRTQSGTALKTSKGEVIYTPPQDAEEIKTLMANLIDFINDSDTAINPLVKMAIIHYQFESIHPFYDGNGRTGRILNLLYLGLMDRLLIPALPLSRYILRNKEEYYRLLQLVRDDNNTADAWQEWLLYMIQGVAEASHVLIAIIDDIKILMQNFKQSTRRDHPSIYSQDLINALFQYPYITIELMQKYLDCHRQTATKHLDILVKGGHLKKYKMGRSNYYINEPLVTCLTKVYS